MKISTNFNFPEPHFKKLFTYHSLDSLNHLYIVSLIRNYDPVKQVYNLVPSHNPTRPLFVPQEALNLNDEYLLPTHVPNILVKFFPKNC